ncbi:MULTISPECIES: helix-turn-helix transcriptional regulator [Vibrio]|uniref:helix-turn-helix transcriptional regulator n=1 Tax=Vibrio TaxID=662 RepID=UPI000682CB38|nr:AlpA family phage regulatory protein [Vibrio harveyi]AWA98347.1 AlpA family phage regulatory protein [Vibrio harveyi]ELI6426302.1 AlpA family phage regulatory protein [Vibrio harveyi]RCR62575.1 AlpA family phage regulatory protein [Vibrio harveyi]HDM8069821.1 AlpA family phage regulatory protein [Vibrio harveyi]HDZ5417453.1 AlpA family phage regulatory protein [Vibrio harveyi]
MMRLIRMREVLEKTGLSKATLYRLIAAGEFPASIQISSRAVGWEESLVDEFLMKKVSQSIFKREQAEMKKSPHYVPPERRVSPYLRY